MEKLSATFWSFYLFNGCLIRVDFIEIVYAVLHSRYQVAQQIPSSNCGIQRQISILIGNMKKNFVEEMKSYILVTSAVELRCLITLI